jgi:excisionase family DNA binding protein
VSGRPKPQSASEFRETEQVNLSPESIEALAVAIVREQKPADALLDAEGAAQLLGVSAKWMLAEAKADRIPHVRLGPKYVRFNRDDLLAWAADRAQGPRVTGSQPVSPNGRSQ